MRPIVAIENLRYAYPPLRAGQEPTPVLRGVSMSLDQGECLALLGPTGAGKSTLCLTLNGVIPHLLGGTFEGRVCVEGRSTRDSAPGALSQHIGIVFQEPEVQLFNMTVVDEVAFGPESLALPPEEIEARIAASLEALRIWDLRDRSPLELSGGEKQRVALAAALALRPKILVLDEPTASLDPVGTRSVLEAIARLRRETGVTILWVTQDVDRVPVLADRVAVLAEGKIVLEGAPRQIFAHEEHLRELGLRVPQTTELALRFNRQRGTDHDWLTVDEAARDLTVAAHD
ncbi:MAG: ATP-binding cassette domain-containing protein [Anaerolineae bacterium]